MVESLQELCDRPMELLAELERRGRAATASPGVPAAYGQEWVGVALRLAGELYLIARDEVREVLTVPAPLTRVPGAPRWIRGIASVRGQILPIIDLRDFLGGGASPEGRNTRIVVAASREVPAGLIVDEVQGFRRFTETDFSADLPATAISGAQFLAGSFPQTGQSVPVLSLRKLLEDPQFLGASADRSAAGRA
jgi:twitching motility protein PilI